MKKNGFIASGLLISLLIVMIYIIGTITIYTVKLKYNKISRIDKTNVLLDDSDNEYKRLKARVIYGKK